MHKSKANVYGYAILTILLSGAAYYYSSFFDAQWWLAWLAPIPLLIFTYKHSWLPAIIVAFVVGLVPGLNQLIGYLPTTLPMLGSFYDMLINGAELAVVIFITHWLVRGRQTGVNFIAFPILMSVKEWGESYTALGNYNSVAYSQLHFLPVVQVASVAGYVGITFVVCIFAAAVSYFICYYRTHKVSAITSLILGLGIMGIAVGLGWYRLHNEKYTQHVKVGLVSVIHWSRVTYDDTQAVRLAKEYAPFIQKVAAKGAKIVLLPEESLTVTQASMQHIQQLLASIAKRNDVYLIIGVNEKLNNERLNSAWVFNNDGALVGKYYKRHLVPGVEDGITPKKSLLVFKYDDNLFGVAICHDMDYTNPAKEYGVKQVSVLFVPAWDFTVDAWVHDTGAIMRGVENHYTIVRAARNGYLGVTTKTGRVIGLKRDSAEGESLVVNVPVD